MSIVFVCAQKFFLNSTIHRVGKERQRRLDDLTVDEFRVDANYLHGRHIVSVAYRVLFETKVKLIKGVLDLDVTLATPEIMG